MKEINWYRDILSEAEGYEEFYSASVQDKALLINKVVNSGVEAKVKAMILCRNKEKDKTEIEYFYRRTIVGMGDEFLKKVDDFIKFKKVELEMVARGIDFE